MKPAGALGSAIACAALATAIVAVDLAYTFELRIEDFDGIGWNVVAADPYDPDRHGRSWSGCARPQVRVVVDNHRPIAAGGNLLTHYLDANGVRHPGAQIDGGWDAFEIATSEWAIPPEAFEGPPSAGARPVKGTVTVVAELGDRTLSACVQPEAA